jgi:hypothetical protein
MDYAGRMVAAREDGRLLLIEHETGRQRPGRPMEMRRIRLDLDQAELLHKQLSAALRKLRKAER